MRRPSKVVQMNRRIKAQLRRAKVSREEREVRRAVLRGRQGKLFNRVELLRVALDLRQHELDHPLEDVA